MAGVFNAFLAYKFIKILTTPFDEQEAFDLGIIDDEGTVINKPTSRDQKKSYTTFHKIIFNLKKILAKFPGGKSRIASYAAAMALLKENNEGLRPSDINVMENLLMDYINLQEEETRNNMLTEEIVNTASPAALGNFNANPFKKTFAGMRVFPVKSDAYNKFLKGKKKYSHWDPFLRREDSTEIRAYVKRYPTNKIVLQDEQYGTMTILHRDL